ncbi:DUF5615 family PIN-like protein [Nitrospira sp. T9]|uniref:DUF5615 family PIN-like protein n=1 Tax=unclassified Nitrospira TaxID=2652172 RepID=UPI003F9B247F
MKFLVDAQLPQHLAQVLTVAGDDTLHTLDLPGANCTRDEELADLAARENRILITKDADFVTTFHLQHRPPKLLLVSTGNIENATLLHLFVTNINSGLGNTSFVSPAEAKPILPQKCSRLI